MHTFGRMFVCVCIMYVRTEFRKKFEAHKLRLNISLFIVHSNVLLKRVSYNGWLNHFGLFC